MGSYRRKGICCQGWRRNRIFNIEDGDACPSVALAKEGDRVFNINMENEIEIFYSKDWSFDPTQGKLDYELLDTGEGEKLERFGPYIFVRPYEDAVWPKALTKEMKELWNRADGKFWSSKQGAKSGWKFNHKIEKKWIMEYKPARHASQGDASGGIKF